MPHKDGNTRRGKKGKSRHSSRKGRGASRKRHEQKVDRCRKQLTLPKLLDKTLNRGNEYD